MHRAPFFLGENLSSGFFYVHIYFGPALASRWINFDFTQKHAKQRRLSGKKWKTRSSTAGLRNSPNRITYSMHIDSIMSVRPYLTEIYSYDSWKVIDSTAENIHSSFWNSLKVLMIGNGIRSSWATGYFDVIRTTVIIPLILLCASFDVLWK